MSRTVLDLAASPSPAANRADVIAPVTRRADAPQRYTNVPVHTPNRAPEGPFTPAERDRLIVEHYGLVKAIARKIRARLPKGVDVDDLISHGTLGLIEAIDRYDASRSVPFEAFARPRIQGAILDALRAVDWVPRSVRRKAEALQHARDSLSESLGRTPNREEIAAHVGIPLEKLERMERGARIRSITSLDAPVGPDGEGTLGATIAVDDDTMERWETEELTDEVVDGIARLPDRERSAVEMYYLGERSLKDIGDVLGVSESRACQLRRQGVERLRFKVRHHFA